MLPNASVPNARVVESLFVTNDVTPQNPRNVNWKAHFLEMCLLSVALESKADLSFL